MEIYVDGENIILRKYMPCCVFCGRHSQERVEFNGKLVCPSCAWDIGGSVGHTTD